MISIIIPTFNEEQALPATLRSVLEQRGDYEVIIVDGGSTDRTPAIAAAQSRSRLLHAPKGRASQMNMGARMAAGEWLLFLHADTMLPEGALQRLNNSERDLTIQAGGFLHRVSGNDWRLRLISRLDNFRCRHSRVIYGDQAMFVRRRLFERLGGFPDQPILEDVAFCENLIRHIRPVLFSPPVITDSRKFVKMGIWRSLIRVFLIILSVQFHLPVLSRGFFQDIR
jgi:rSAM/selenodomain-associated transferase 2